MIASRNAPLALDQRNELAQIPHSITVETLTEELVRELHGLPSSDVGHPTVVERHHGRLSKICTTHSRIGYDLGATPEYIADATAHTYGASYVLRAERYPIGPNYTATGIVVGNRGELKVVLCDTHSILGSSPIRTLDDADPELVRLLDEAADTVMDTGNRVVYRDGEAIWFCRCGLIARLFDSTLPYYPCSHCAEQLI